MVKHPILNLQESEIFMKPTIVLASASPRRLEILQMFGLAPEVHVSSVDETVNGKLSPEETVLYL